MPGVDTKINPGPPFYLIYRDPGSQSQTPIPSWILADSGIAEAEDDGQAEAMVRFRVQWSTRYMAIKALRGQVTKDEMTGHVLRVGAMVYPPSPNMICTAIASCTPVGTMSASVNGWPSWDWADVTARFSVPQYDKTTFIEIRIETSGEVLTFKDTTWHLVNDNKTSVGSEIGLPLPQAKITYTVYRMPYLPLDAVAELMGSINDHDFWIGDHKYLEGTLLFVGANTEESYTTAGVEYRVEYSFVHRMADWNQYMSPDSGEWTYVSHDGTQDGVMPFEYKDFTTIPGLPDQPIIP